MKVKGSRFSQMGEWPGMVRTTTRSGSENMQRSEHRLCQRCRVQSVNCTRLKPFEERMGAEDLKDGLQMTLEQLTSGRS